MRSNKLKVLIATFILIFPTLLGLGTATKALAAGTVDITLHKKRYSTAQAEIQNTGEVMPGFAAAKGFGGVEFKVYDVTDDFYALLNSTNPDTGDRYTMQEALDEVQGEDYSTATAVQTQTTSSAAGSEGDAVFAGLPDKTNGKNAVYVFVETPMAGVTAADNMVVALPMDKTDGTINTDIHLYPKNVVETAGIEVEKISNIDDGAGGVVPLAGVGFVIHKDGDYSAAGTSYLKGFDLSDTPLWTTVKADAKVYTTDTDGTFAEDKLLYGTYYLTEVSTITGYAIQNGAVNQQFTLNATTPLASFTGADAIQNDDIRVAKTNTGGTVNVGDKISYTIETVIPNGIADEIDTDGDGIADAKRYTTYKITDTHGVHLELDDSTLTLSDGTTNFAAPTHYTLDETTPGVFVISFTAAGIAAMKPNATLTVEYDMELLQTVAPGEEVLNNAKVETDYDDDNGDGSENYTGGYNFKKIDGSNDDAVIAGAEFVVRKADNDTAQYLKIGTNGEVTWEAAEADATTFTSDASGIVTVKGLEDGTYYLEETKTANDKYILLAARVAFTVTQTSFDDTDPLTGVPLDVVNKQKGSLPSTGGTGIYVIMAVGTLIMVAVGYGYVRSQRKEA